MRFACFVLWIVSAIGQPAPPALFVTQAHPERSLVAFAPPSSLPWDRIVRAHAPGFDFDHLKADQIAWIRKNPDDAPARKGYRFCVTVPLQPGMHKAAFWLIGTRGVTTLRVSGMRACAEFGPEEGSALRPRAYSGSILAYLPGKGVDAAGFVVRSDRAAPRVLPKTNRRFEATFASAGGRTSVTCIYSAGGSAGVKAELDAKSRESLESWWPLQVDGRDYALVVWKSAGGPCDHLYSLFQTGSALSELAEAAGGCHS